MDEDIPSWGLGIAVVLTAVCKKSWGGTLAAPSGTPRSATLQLLLVFICNGCRNFVGDDKSGDDEA